jgi:hypothetical protein
MGRRSHFESYTPDFTNKLYMREFANLYKNSGVNGEDRGFHITHDAYGSDKFFLAYDLSPDRCNG